MKSLMQYLKPYKKQCIIGPFCKWLEAILELLLPTIMAFMINNGVMVHDQRVVFVYGGIMVGMVFIGFGFSLICQYNAALASQGFGTDLRNALFSRVMAFSFEYLDHFQEATLINRVGNDVNQLQVAVAMLIRLVVRSPFIVIGAILMAMILDVSLSLILLATVPIIGLVLYGLIHATTPLYTAYQKKSDHFLHVLEQNLSGVRVIRAFLSQKQERQRLEDASTDLQRQMMKVARLSALLNPMTALIVNGAIVMLLWNGVISLPAGIPAGTLVAFINYATQILLACVAVSNLIVIFTKAAASAKRVTELLEVTATLQEGKETTILKEQEAIHCDHMCFTYPQSPTPSLSHLTFTIQAGETIGIIGGTGSGKTTLAAALMRFYDSDGLYVFGRLLSSYDPATRASLIALIPQKNELFSGTIAENLRYGNECASDAQLWEALRIAQAEEFVKEKGEGLQMRIETLGKNLSGGQRQRLCIARGILTNAKILIFDDSFSALDYQTDARLRKELSSMKERTKLIISQRVATLWNCDRILVLDNGHLVGFATHQVLYDTCEIYREICISQNIGREVMI